MAKIVFYTVTALLVSVCALFSNTDALAQSRIQCAATYQSQGAGIVALNKLLEAFISMHKGTIHDYKESPLAERMQQTLNSADVARSNFVSSLDNYITKLEEYQVVLRECMNQNMP